MFNLVSYNCKYLPHTGNVSSLAVPPPFPPVNTHVWTSLDIKCYNFIHITVADQSRCFYHIFISIFLNSWII